MTQSIPYYILTAIAVLISLTVHEYSHGLAAYKLGDTTARDMGRLTLNPIKHIDPIGALCLLFFHVGWAKPVPINARNFRHPKRDFAITALAGPVSNLIMAFVFSGLYLLLAATLRGVEFTSNVLYYFALYSLQLLYLFHIINTGLGIFNLIPVPPLDGSRILNVVLPPKWYFGIMKYERVIYYCLLGWLLVGSWLSSVLLSLPVVAGNPVLTVIARILSLSDLIGYAVKWVSGLMMSFWRLIPYLNI